MKLPNKKLQVDLNICDRFFRGCLWLKCDRVAQAMPERRRRTFEERFKVIPICCNCSLDRFLEVLSSAIARRIFEAKYFPVWLISLTNYKKLLL